MFTEKAKTIAEACRFCWMCRHTCPVGLVTGKEGNNARAKGLLVSMDERNEPMTVDTMNVMYECALCKACTNDCATGFDPSVYILEARTKAVVDDLVPENVKKVLDRATAGCLVEEKINKDFADRIKILPAHAPVVLYVGAWGRRSGATVAMAYMDLLEKAKVEFTVLQEEPESGAHLGELMGYVEDVRQRAKQCQEAISKTEANTLVVLDPTDCAFMKHVWEEWSLPMPKEVVTATAYMEKLIQDKKLNPKKLNIKATYHDPCRLARDLDETEPARYIMEAMGVELKELFLNRKLTKCCGGAVLKENYPDIAEKTAQARWKDVTSAGQNNLITACPSCFTILGDQTPEGYKIFDIFLLLNEAC